MRLMRSTLFTRKLNMYWMSEAGALGKELSQTMLFQLFGKNVGKVLWARLRNYDEVEAR